MQKLIILILLPFIFAFTNEDIKPSSNNYESYEEKLLNLRSIVPITFDSTITYFQRHEAVNNLYRLLYSDDDIKTYFGLDKLIDRIIVNSKPTPGYLDLYDHTLLFYYKGNTNIRHYIKNFKFDLEAISHYENKIKRLVHNFQPYRLLHKNHTSSNSSYLHNLKAIYSSLENHPEKLQAISKYSSFIIYDTPQVNDRTNILIKKIAAKDKLVLTLARFGVNQKDSIVTTSLVSKLLNIILLGGFRGVIFEPDMMEKNIGFAVDQLTEFLTYNMTSFLQRKGVRYIHLTSKSNVYSFGNGFLTMGYSTREMNYAINNLF